MTRPVDILQEARNLIDGADRSDVRLRTVLGRAYYAAFHFIINHPCAGGYAKYRKEADTGRHRALINFLSKSSDRTIQYVAQTLDQLYSRRIKADYVLHIPILHAHAEDSVELVEELIEETLVGWVAPADTSV